MGLFAQDVRSMVVNLLNINFPSVPVNGINPVKSMTFEQICINFTKPDLRRIIRSAVHLSENAKYLFVDQAVLLHLRKDAVFVWVVLHTVAETQTHIAITISLKEGISLRDTKDFEIQQTDGGIRVVFDADWKIMECSFDIGVKSVKGVEVLDVFNMPCDISVVS